MQSPPSQIADALRRLSESDALRELENRLAAQNAFNLFDAIGVSNQELRHSDFLAFLLRPNEAHGLGDTFLKWFLGHALAHSPAPPISHDTLNQWDLSDALVQREWQKIDLFITSPKNRLAVVVENKIFTGEHDDQLTRYKEIAEASGYSSSNKRLLCVYLTPHGGKPSHVDYLPIGYETVCAHLEMLCKTGAFARAASPDIETTIKHYTRMLRRKIVGDPEITKLCRDLYAKHQIAFDRVFAERDTKQIQKSVTVDLKLLVEESGAFIAYYSSYYKGVDYQHFVPKSWADEQGLMKTNPSNWRYMYLQTEVYPNGQIDITGTIAPGSSPVRNRLVNLVSQTLWLGQVSPHPTAPQYLNYYRYTLREPGNLLQESDDMADAWQEWVETEGPKFATLIQPGDFPAV